MYKRKTITQPWVIRLTFRGGDQTDIKLPADMSTKAVWRWVRETYWGERPKIEILTKGRKQLKRTVNC